MKNAKLLRNQHNDVVLAVGETLHLCVQCSLDTFCAVTSAGRIVQFTWNDEETGGLQERVVEVQTAAELPNPSEEVVTCLSYSLEQEKCIIGTSGGNLMTYDAEVGVEKAGTLDSAVLAIEVSPDGQLTAILTGSGQLLLMSPFWEVEAETSVQVGLEGGQAVVNESTADFQHGSVAVIWRGDSRYLATVTQSSDECASLSGFCDLMLQGGVNAKAKCSMFCRPTATLRVWSPEGCRLEHIGDVDADEAQGLLPMAAWQPNGRNIYCVQSMGPKTRICIFERNGLGHGSFIVSNEQDLEISQLAWSPDSTVLAITGTSQDGANFVQLWQRRNWHWYCVREAWRGSERPLQLLWCEHSTAALFVCSESGRVERWEFFFAADASPRGSVAVIDGSEVLLTPLRLAVVPPPLCAVRVSTPHAVSAVAWGEVNGCECLALTHGSGVSVVAAVEEDLWEETLEECDNGGAREVGEQGAGSICSNLLALPAGCKDLDYAIKSCASLTWLHSELLAAVVPRSAHPDMAADAVVMLKLSWPRQDHSTGLWGAPAVVSCAMHSAQGCITACVPWDLSHVLLQDNQGQLSLMAEQGTSSALSNLPAFPEHCQQILVHKRSSQKSVGQQSPRVLGLSGSGKLFEGREVLATNVNSMCLRHWGPGGAYLLVTTRSQVLYCAQLERASAAGPASPRVQSSPYGVRHPEGAGGHVHTQYAELQLSEAATRPVEAGAELVAAPPGTSLAVMQMPRGNLEGVHVRALTLASVTEKLLAHQYGDAMEEAASHRVDLNVLVDFQWPRFLDHVGDFVAQVKADSVCDLLSSLRPENCLSEGQIYASELAQLSEVAPITVDEPQPVEGSADEEGAERDKLTCVCEALQRECVQAGGAHLRAALMSFVRTQPQDLESAVGVIQVQKEKELAAGAGCEGSVNAESLAQFLLLHVEADQAYRAALARYDLRMAYFLISLSQKDPAEHLLELEKFHSIQPEALQQHAIDSKLGRHIIALKNAVRAGKEHHDTALKYAQSHGLLRQLLDLLSDDPELLLKTQREYAQDLEQAGRLPDAAVAYLACELAEGAIRCYEHAGEWQMAFALLLQSKPDATRIRSLGLSLVDHLKATGRSSEAGTVAATYLRDGNLALQHYVDAGEWRLALGVVGQLQNDNMLIDTLKPAAAAAAVTMLSDLQDDQGRVDKYWSRLKQLRSKRQQLAAKVGVDGELQDVDTLPDNMTDVVSLASGMSAYTDRSVKNSSIYSSSRQTASTIGGQGATKSKKKGRSRKIRQGTPEEEQKLCLLLSELAPSPELCTQGSQLAELLVLLGHVTDAAKLQGALDGYVKAFVASAEDMLSTPAPPANSTLKAAEDAKKTSTQLQVKLHGLKTASWKWSLLRPVTET